MALPQRHCRASQDARAEWRSWRAVLFDESPRAEYVLTRRVATSARLWVHAKLGTQVLELNRVASSNSPGERTHSCRR